YVLVTDSECESGGLASTATALIEVLNLDGSGYEIFSLPTRRTSVDGQQVTQYKNQYGEWVVIRRDERDMIPYGFYGYTMTDNGEIELKALSETGAQELEVLPGMVRADGKQQFIFGDDAHNLVLNRDSLMHLVTEKGVETIEGYQNMEIDEAAVNALVIYGGRTVREVFVVNGSLIEKDIYAYYNGTEFQISGSKTYIPMYVGGELQYYTFANITVGGGIDTMINEELPDGVYKIDLEGNRIVAMDSVLTESWSKTTVTSVSSTGKYFSVEGMNVNEVNVTYADGVEIYDLTDGGTVVDGVAKGDTILYLNNSTDKGEVATHIWIVKHYKSLPIVNDAPVEEAFVME
ncbi:MAG: hypothetical protein IIY00_01185, partial [Clostridia bacterium]|nr:hypothetical protein [Clostridia bacterium]